MKHRRKIAIGSVLLLAGFAAVASGWFAPTETTVTELAPGVSPPLRAPG